MNEERSQKDLIVLVADKNMEDTIRTLLEKRTKSLKIREISFEILRHPKRDPGVLRKSHELLRRYVQDFRYALVIFDREGCGQDLPPGELAQRVQENLDRSGWRGRSSVIVIDPELEIWVFAGPHHVTQVFAKGDSSVYREVLQNSEINQTTGKPKNPKKVVEAILRKVKLPRSSALYAELAENVGLRRCTDPAFLKLRTVLQKWFPPRRTP